MELKRFRWRIAPAVGAVLLICGIVSSACRRTAGAEPGDPVVRIGFGIGSSAKDTSLTALTLLLYAESLLTRGWDGRAMPRLAESWAWSADARTLTLHLKSGVKLHDSVPFTAHVAAEVLAGFLNQPEKKKPWGFEHVTGVRAEDDKTLVLTLSQPDIFLLSGLADRKMIRPASPDIGTGPFQLVSREPVVEARRFDGYHGGPSHLAGVRIITYDTTRSVWSALMRGEVDAAQEVSRDSVEFMERSANVENYPALHSFYVAMVFNHRHPALRNVGVRRALNEALDRAAIINRAMRGQGREAQTPVWPLHWAYSEPSGRYRYDTASANARLDRAGFRLPGHVPAGQIKSRFKFTCMVYNEDPQYERIALLVQRQLFEIGVDMKIELVEMDDFESRAGQGNFDAFLMRANAGRSLDFAYRLWHSTAGGAGALQNTGYSGADELLDALRASTSDEQTRAAVAGLTQKFYDDAPAAFIAWLEITRAIDTRFEVGPTGTGDPFVDIWQWRPSERDREDR